MFADDKSKAKRITDPHQAYLKARGYCAYQERSQQEVRDKLYEWGMWKEAVEDIIVKLIDANFLNEERFAIAFAGGKFRIKKWGKIKIRQALKQKGTSDYCIKKGLAAIDYDDYLNTLKEILNQKSKSTKSKNPLQRKYKIAQYAMSRGFESNLIWEELGGEN
jgi:regulatory protein